MDKIKNYQSLKKYCLGQGVDLFGVAGIEPIKDECMLPKESLEQCGSAVVLGMGLSKGVLHQIKDAPTRLYFHHYKTANMFLDQTAFQVSRYIEKKGFNAIPIPASQIVDWQEQKAHLPHKKAALLAGLGWIGRNNLLVNKKLGAKLRLVTILTDMPLKQDKTTKESCGTCKVCVSLCPAGAIKESPEEFDHIKCFEKLKEFQKQRLVDQYICGICVNACAGKC